MAIAPLPLRIGYTSESFPAGSTPNVSSDLDVSWDEIVWAALTIGRPSVHHTFHHGTHSGYEAIFRISLVRMALQRSTPGGRRLRRTDVYKGMDPTEKGAVSYFLGMAFCKVFSTRLLNTPWLLHLDIFRSVIPVSTLGRSRPDLIGQQVRTGNWLAFETKGRASTPSSLDKAKAKQQATRLVSVAGRACSLHIGAITYFYGDTLKYYWRDPEPGKKKPIHVPEIGDAWRFYYEPVWNLWRENASRTGSDGNFISLPELDVEIFIHPVLAPLLLAEAWEESQREMLKLNDLLAAEGFRPDGLKIKCGPSWLARQFRKVPVE